MQIDIKSCNTPNLYDTYHTFITDIWQNVFTRRVQQKIKAPVKVNPFSVFLLSDWSELLCTYQSISGRTSSRLYEYKTFYDKHSFKIKCLF